MITPKLKKWIAQQAKEMEKWPLAHRIAAGLLAAGVTEYDFSKDLFPERDRISGPYLNDIVNALRDIQRDPAQFRPPEHLVIPVGGSIGKTSP